MDGSDAPALLPPGFEAWFASRGWRPRAHQLDMVAQARAGRDALLIAPTGGGKTLAGFLPSLIELSAQGPRPEGAGVHTLYISPLKALAVDVARNLETPVREMGLDVSIESRSGDSSVAKRQRQRDQPPDILLTTPEQLALFCAWEGARRYFADLRCVILDEIHAIHASKRGDLLALGLARLSSFAPAARRVGLSATVENPERLLRWLGRGFLFHPATELPHAAEPRSAPLPLEGGGVGGEGVSRAGAGVGAEALRPIRSQPQQTSTATYVETPPSPALPPSRGKGAEMAAQLLEVALVLGAPGPSPIIDVLISGGRVPWSGHSSAHAIPEVYALIQRSKTALVFVNTRWQAEFAFQALWAINEQNLPIGLHHGSLAAEQRRKVEAAMARGELRAVVCTSTLDLGIDWGDVDLVIQLSAPKGSSRMVQRIGRANHRLDEPSRAVLVPANRFEMLECQAAREAVAENALDGDPVRAGALDVLAQHVMGVACSEPFDLVELYEEVRSAYPYADLSWEDWETVVDFVSTGGYALKVYDRFRRIVKGRDGRWKVRTREVAARHRLNVGAIVSPGTLNLRVAGAGGSAGRKVGEVEEGYLEQLFPGDSFLFAGMTWRFEAIKGIDALVSPSTDPDPIMPSWGGSKFALSTYLASRVRRMMADETAWPGLPPDVAEWMAVQKQRSAIPGPDEMLVESFPRGRRNYLVCYPFDGRLSHTTLAMLLTRRLERAGVGPLGYVCNDYALAVWAMRPMIDLDLGALFSEDMLGDDLEAWMDESFMMKRAFKDCALVAGLIDRRLPGQERTGRQVTFSTDLIYDVLRSHQPDHLLLRCARTDAATGMLDIGRMAALLARIRGRIRPMALRRVSPFAVPIMMEIGRERVRGEGEDEVLAANEAELIAEALGEAEPPSAEEADTLHQIAWSPELRVQPSRRGPWRGRAGRGGGGGGARGKKARPAPSSLPPA